MFKRIFYILLVIIILTPINVNASDTSSFIVLNADTHEIIFGNNYKTPMAIASTTKIMTAVIAIENASPTDIFTVSVNAQNQEGSSVYLKSGQQISLNDLLYALMLNSGNDASIVIAENIGGSITGFTNMMNDKAKELGMKNTHFDNPSGLPSQNHYSTAYDMSLLMAYAINNDYFKEIVSKKEYQIKTESTITYLKNHNKMLWIYPYCIGGKTGYTKDAGRCLVSCSVKDDKKIVCVTLNCHDDWQEHINHSDNAFKQIDRIKIMKKYDILTTRKYRGIPINLIINEDITLSIIDKNIRNLKCKISIDDRMNKEIQIGEKIGYGHIYYNNHPITTVELVSGQNIPIQPTNVFNNNLNYVLNKFLLKN